MLLLITLLVIFVLPLYICRHAITDVYRKLRALPKPLALLVIAGTAYCIAWGGQKPDPPTPPDKPLWEHDIDAYIYECQVIDGEPIFIPIMRVEELKNEIND